MPNKITLEEDRIKHVEFKKFKKDTKQKLKELKAKCKVMLGFGNIEDYVLYMKGTGQKKVSLSPEIYVLVNYAVDIKIEGIRVRLSGKTIDKKLTEQRWFMKKDWRTGHYTPVDEEQMKQMALSKAIRIGEQLQGYGLDVKINEKLLNEAQEADVKSLKYEDRAVWPWVF